LDGVSVIAVIFPTVHEIKILIKKCRAKKPKGKIGSKKEARNAGEILTRLEFKGELRNAKYRYLSKKTKKMSKKFSFGVTEGKIASKKTIVSKLS
jgi:hypothetical protein